MVVEEDLPDWLQEFSDELPVASEAEPASLDLTPDCPRSSRDTCLYPTRRR